jgi:hypothetical protein
MRALIGFGAVAVVAMGCTGIRHSNPPPREKPVSLLMMGDIKGTLEPCGCTSYPLGGIYRLGSYARTVTSSNAGTALLAGGDLLYESEHETPSSRAQDEARAEVLVSAFSRLGLWASAVGETDRPETPRFAELVKPAAFSFLSAKVGRASELREVGGLRVGVLAVRAGEDAAAATSALRKSGAQVVVLLAHASRAEARAIAAATPEADFVFVGHATEPQRRPEKVGAAVLLEAGGLGQYVGRLDLYAPRPGERFVDGEPGRDAILIAELRASQAERKLLEGRKYRLPEETVRFLEAALRHARTESERERALAAGARPVGRNHFLWRLVALDASVGEDPEILALRHRYKARLREINMREADRLKAPPASPGAATYRGNASCSSCHYREYQFWKKTGHAQAWTTLTRAQSDYDLSCVGCHMTGYLKPGGSSLSERAELHAVGCESCHGPGSRHEDAPDPEKKALIARNLPEGTCLTCHTPEHSDLFSFATYRRRIIGPGHGEPLPQAVGVKP